jgi:hypothetical protein
VRRAWPDACHRVMRRLLHVDLQRRNGTGCALSRRLHDFLERGILPLAKRLA